LQHEPTLTVSELFYSLQGESSYAGYPCVFIRLTGCNLRCSYCDSRYSYEEEGRQMPLTEILAYAQSRPTALVTITGGEPLLQENIYTLMKQLLAANRNVLIETNGSLGISKIPSDVVKVLDLKCPDSGMQEKMDYKNLHFLSPRDEIKFVLSSRDDYDWAVAVITKYHLERTAKLLFSPVVGRLAQTELAEWLLADELPVRLQMQLHKVLWPTAVRGK
jgi:7-carboxy-7-deazaguanine synthase